MVRVLSYALLALSFFSIAGCGAKSYTSMTPAEQATLKKNLEMVAVLFENYTLENGKCPANWDELSQHAKEVEAEVDFNAVKRAGYKVNWSLAADEVTGSAASNVVVAQAGADGPKAYADGTVK